MALLTACGNGIESRELLGDPVAVLQAQTANAPFPGMPQGALGGAMLWQRLPASLVTCLAAANDVDAIYECAGLEFDAEMVAATVPIEAEAPVSFSIPLQTVPPTTVLSNHGSGRFGWAAVVVFHDGNGNGTLDLAAPGTAQPDDMVVGTSTRYDQTLEAGEYHFAVYREGTLSSAYKLFSILGCPEVGVGFSVVHLVPTELDWSCSVEGLGSVLPIYLDDSEWTRSFVCRPNDYDYSGYPDAAPAGSAAIECIDEYTLVTSPDPMALCPLIERVDLIGCEDWTSTATCENTAWDFSFDPPTWWPCSGGGGGGTTYYNVTDVDGAPTAAVDELLSLGVATGTDRFAVSDLEVDLYFDEDDGHVTLSGDRLRLQDNDANGVFNMGDQLFVSEPTDQGALFGPDSFGYFPVLLYRVDGMSRTLLSVSQFWMPQPMPPTPADIGLTLTDDPSELSPATDEPLFTFTYSSGTETFDVELLVVNVNYSFEAPMFGIDGAPFIHQDNDVDGRFSLGDVLEVREGNVSSFGLDGGEGPGEHWATLSLHLGVNYRVQIGGALWEP